MSAKPDQTREALALLATEPWRSDRDIARQVDLGNKTVSRLRAEANIGRGGPSIGLLTTAELASAAGVSERKLRRWRALLPEPVRHWHGKRQVLLYRPQTVEYVSTLADLADRYHGLEPAALGLFALGYPVPESAVRAAHLSWIEAFDGSILGLAERMAGGRDEDSLFEQVRTSRRFAWARRVAQAMQELDGTDEAKAIAAWNYVQRVVGIFARGTFGSDGDIRAALEQAARMLQRARRQAVKDPPDADTNDACARMPIGRQVAIFSSINAAISTSSLQATATRASFADIRRARDQTAALYVGFFMLYDGGMALAGREEGVPALCEVLTDDPAGVAKLALILAALERGPKIGSDLTAWLDEVRGLILEVAPVVFARIAGSVPNLEALAHRYLSGRLDETAVAGAP